MRARGLPKQNVGFAAIRTPKKKAKKEEMNQKKGTSTDWVGTRQIRADRRTGGQAGGPISLAVYAGWFDKEGRQCIDGERTQALKIGEVRGGRQKTD